MRSLLCYLGSQSSPGLLSKEADNEGVYVAFGFVVVVLLIAGWNIFKGGKK